MLDRSVVRHFHELEQQLATRFPEAIVEAKQLAADIADPITSDADAIWSKFWDKPLYSNTRVEIGSGMRQRLAPFMHQAWDKWGDGRDVAIAKVGPGICKSSFVAVTPAARDVRAQTGIAMHRLYAIQFACAAMRKRVAASDRPYASLASIQIEPMLRGVLGELGTGWGHITAMHFLTDLGLVCKPDMHLVRTVRHLGLTLDIKDRKVPNLKDSVTINERVRELLGMIDGEIRPARLRYLDKVLMDISSYGVI